MSYLKNLVDSFTNPQTYRQFIRAGSKKAFGHFALSMLLIGFFQGLYLGIVGLPDLQEKAQAGLDQLITVYPDDLQITWDGEQLTTAPEEYHLLHFNPSQLTVFKQMPNDLFFNQAMLYTNQDLSLGEAVDLMSEENVAGIIDQQSIFFSSDDAGVQELSLKEYFQDTSFMIEKDSLPVIGDYLGQELDAVLKTAVWFLPIVIAIAMLFSRSIIALFFATLLFFPARLGKVIDSWQKSWRFTLVLLVVVEILNQITKLLYPQLTFPVYSLAFWSLSLFILLALNAKKTNQQTKKRLSR